VIDWFKDRTIVTAQSIRDSAPFSRVGGRVRRRRDRNGHLKQRRKNHRRQQIRLSAGRPWHHFEHAHVPFSRGEGKDQPGATGEDRSVDDSPVMQFGRYALGDRQRLEPGRLALAIHMTTIHTSLRG